MPVAPTLYDLPGNLIGYSVDTPGDSDTTHPSKHNAVVLVGDKLSEVKKRMCEDNVEQRAHAALKHWHKNMAKGRPETWTDVQARNRSTNREGHEVEPLRSGQDFSSAFYG